MSEIIINIRRIAETVRRQLGADLPAGRSVAVAERQAPGLEGDIRRTGGERPLAGIALRASRLRPE